MPIYLNGLFLGFSLITALGPQNIFLIRQGVKRNHAILSAITCFFCDFILIIASVFGLQSVFTAHPMVRVWMVWFGAAFLMYYGVATLKQAFSEQTLVMNSDGPHPTRGQIIMLALGFSLLNPHAIIDSLVLIGGGSGQFPGHQHTFLLGVLSSSLLWFTALTFTTSYFSNVLSRVKVWKTVEFSSGCLMVFLSLKLVYSQHIFS